MSAVREVFQPRLGRALCIAVDAVCIGAMVALVARDGPSALWHAGPWLALMAGFCWALYWRPEVVVDDGGVRLVNVFRTIDLPWPSIQAIDTKWALTLITAYGKYTGWAAPAPGMREAVRATSRDSRHLPKSALSSEGIRPGDLPSSASGGAALLIRRRWEELRDAGHLDDPRLERETAPVTWHRMTIVVGVGLMVLCLVGLAV
jgi:PH (Pleckstrin Homology) domain-containing protein